MRPAAALFLISLSLPAFAWGPEGHALVARIAEAQLTAAARARVAEILGPGQSIASVASWADEVRRSRAASGPWHYVDIPIGQRRLDMQRDCAKGDCIVAALDRFRQTLRNPAAPPAERREALMFVIHFIGDMHQPLHASDDGDKGGNTVHVTFHDRQTNLHSLWDSALLGRIGSEEQLLPGLEVDASKRRKKFAKGSVEQWIEQSHREAEKVVYGKLPKSPASAPRLIDARYENAAAPLIREQIERAGVRLAQVLNADLR